MMKVALKGKSFDSCTAMDLPENVHIKARKNLLLNIEDVSQVIEYSASDMTFGKANNIARQR